MEERKRAVYIKHVLDRPLSDDVAFAVLDQHVPTYLMITLLIQRAWFWIANQDPFVEHCKTQNAQLLALPKGSVERSIGDECSEWFWAAERLGLLMHYFGEYGALEEKQAKKIASA